jgi:hypothetical protein
MSNVSRFRHFCAHLTAAVLLVAAARPAAAEPGLAMYQIGPGWATFGLALPRGAAPASNGVRVGTLATQTDVKTTWDDGSIRFAVVTVNGGSDLNPHHYPILPGPAPLSGDPLTPAWPSASVSLNIGGTTYVADLPEAAAEDRWLSGPLVVESRAYVTPMAGGAAHPVLRVLFDVRSYVGGGHRVDVTVENSLDVIEGDAFTYDVAVTVGGAEVFAKSGVVHGYLARWRQVFHTAGVAEGHVVPDFGPYFRSNALPPYLPSIDAPALSVDGPAFDILRPGAVMVPMNAHGGRAELAPYPDWTAQYIVHKRDYQRDFVLKHGELAGSWGIHIKSPDGIGMISIDDRPDFWLWFPDENAPGEDRPANGLRGLAERGDIAHQPSLAYVPYLVTGDRYFLDEVKYWGNFTLLATYQDTNSSRRGGSLGLLEPNEVRGIGWGLRNIVDAAVATPDDDPMKGYFAEKVRNNLAWLDTVATSTSSPSPLGFMLPNRRAEDGFPGWTPYAWISMWEQSYVGWAIDHAIRQGLATGTPKIGTRFRDRLANTNLKLFTSATFPRSWAGSYLFAVGRHSTTPVTGDDRITYFTDLSQVFTATSAPMCGEPTPAPCNERPFEGYYGPEVRLMLMIARGFGGTTGGSAQQQYDFIMSHQQGGSGTMMQDLNRRSGWAIAIGGVNPLAADAPPARPGNLRITTTP